MCRQHHILPPSLPRLLPQESQRPLTMTMMRLLSSESELPCLKQAMLKLTSLHRRYRICKQKSNLASSVTAVVTALDFPAFIAKVRREEARRTERRLRLRKVVRSNVSTASHSPTQSTTVTSPRVTTSPDNDNDEVAQLRKRITMLEASNAEVNLLL